MTVIGIAGCTALILAGFGIRDSIRDVANTQFEEILQYNLRIDLNDSGKFDTLLSDFLKNTSKSWELHGATQRSWICRAKR